MTRVTGRRAAESAGLEPRLITAGVEDWPDENATSSNHKTATFEARMVPPLMTRSLIGHQGRPSGIERKARVRLHLRVYLRLARRSRTLTGFRHRAEASGASDATSAF